MLYIGIDLGTSAAKLLLMREDGTIEKIVSKEYPLGFPHPGWSEQDPSNLIARAFYFALYHYTPRLENLQYITLAPGGAKPEKNTRTSFMYVGGKK